MKEVNLDSNQVHDFAVSIFAADILEYIKSHKAEYEEFLQTESYAEESEHDYVKN